MPATSGGVDGTGGDGAQISDAPTFGGGGGGGGYFGGGGGDLVAVDPAPGDGGSGGGGGANFASPLAVTRVSFSSADGTPRLVITPQPASAIQITRTSYNPPGPDTATNASLNAEWIRLKNVGPTSRHVRGWRITDADGNVYRFGRLALRSGASVTVHSGHGRDTRRHRYWNRQRYVWDNTRDLARIYSAKGRLTAQCRHDNRKAGQIRCWTVDG